MPRRVRWAWRFLLAALAFQALVGLSAAIAIDSPLWSVHQRAVASELWGHGDFGPNAEAYRSWVMGPLGGTIVGWAVALLWVVAVPMRRREPWAWWAVAASTVVWFVIDSSLSAIHGVYTNVAFNGLAVSMIALPWAATLRWGLAGARSASVLGV
jgi:hypothetical protein